MKRAGSVCGAFSVVGLALTLSASALAQRAPAPAATAPAPVVAGPPATPPSEPAAPPRPALDTDTRGSAMRAYSAALAARGLGGAEPLSRQILAERLGRIEALLADGRRDEAIGDLVELVESPRFDPLVALEEGRAALFLLGDSLGRAGALGPARGYLQRLVTGDPNNLWYRRAVRTLVDLGLDSDEPAVFVRDLAAVPPSAPEELRSDIAYLSGRSEERAGRSGRALVHYRNVTPRSRFWAQATYLAGLIEVERGRLREGERLFCRIADPKQTPRLAPAFGGGEFFRVRDLARLGLGRVAHETYRFADSRYYYYLVPRDSERLPEALYEAATGRYEAKDYGAARELVDELHRLEVRHPYEDEVIIFDAYVDLGLCEFPKADLKLRKFIARYEPVRNAARRLTRDPQGLDLLVAAVHQGSDPAGVGLGMKADVARALGTLLRVDEAYGRGSRKLAQLDHQLSGLVRANTELEDVAQKLTSPKQVRPRVAPSGGVSPTGDLERAEAQLAEVGRLLRAVEARGSQQEVAELKRRLSELEARVRELATVEPQALPATAGQGLDALVMGERARGDSLAAQGQGLRAELVAEQRRLAADAIARLDLRLSRLLRRARLGRIETVLGKKRALEVEVEALGQGYLPRGAIDSLDAARYLRDDEEFWPDDGEDWADEYVGGEGLR